MAYRLTIELSDRDLRHFRRELRRERESVGIADDEEIMAAARELIAALRASELPDFIVERLVQLESMLAMLTDDDWQLDEAERGQVLAALAYVCDPEDIIPDDIPGIGLLDDAVMIELVFRELRHELAAFADFREFRARLRRGPAGRGGDAAHRARLDRRRAQLLERMRRRRAAEKRRAR